MAEMRQLIIRDRGIFFGYFPRGMGGGNYRTAQVSPARIIERRSVKPWA